MTTSIRQTSSSGLSNRAQWEYKAAPAIAAQNDDGVAWYLGSDNVSLRCVDNGTVLYVPVSYGPGSIISEIGLESKGGGANDGVSVRLVKRALEATVWTAIGLTAPTSFVSPTHSGEIVTLAAPETVVADTVYAIEITAIVATSHAVLYSVGVKTTRRTL